MNPVRGLLLVASHAFGQGLRGTRVVVLGLFAALTPLISLIIVKSGGDIDREAWSFLVLFLNLQAVVPLLALFLGVAVIGDEIEGRTITYLFTRPLPRPVFYLGRLFGFAAAYLPILTISLVASAALFRQRLGSEAAAVGIPLALVLGGFFVYLTIFALLRVFFRRAIFIGFILATIFEGFVSKLPGGTISRLSLWHHLSLIYVRKAPGVRFEEDVLPFFDATETVSGSVQALAATALVALAIGCWQVHRREVPLPPAMA